jgi:hypothetical protein
VALSRSDSMLNPGQDKATQAKDQQ